MWVGILPSSEEENICKSGEKRILTGSINLFLFYLPDLNLKIAFLNFIL